MLRRVQSDMFLDPNPIEFHDGLNIVLGDGSNSIGKTSLLKVIDFAFGGNYYLDSSDDVFKNVGHHDICFSHEFGQESLMYFRRNTKERKKVYICDTQFYVLDQIDISEFNTLLLHNMNAGYENITFRSLVSLYSRIWSKPNRDVNHPLFLYNNQTTKNAILNLIKTFKLYGSIDKYYQDITELTSTYQAFQTAKKYNIISSISKSEYTKNSKRIKEIDNEITRLENEVSIVKQNEEFVLIESNQNLFRDRQVILRHIYQNKQELRRICDNLKSEYNVKDKYSFEQLLDFFPSLNTKKLDEISVFHDSIKTILNEELSKAEQDVRSRINNLEKQLQQIDASISQAYKLKSQSSELVEKIIQLTREKDELENINRNYSEQSTIRTKKSSSKENPEQEMLGITKDIEDRINKRIFEFASYIESKNNRAPTLELKSERYSFGVQDNTGTGKAYTDLILFDLAILSLTSLPILIHDSFLFNNIGHNTIGSFIKLYNSIKNKQMFISIDRMYDHNKEIQEILLSTSVKFLGVIR